MILLHLCYTFFPFSILSLNDLEQTLKVTKTIYNLLLADSFLNAIYAAVAYMENLEASE